METLFPFFFIPQNFPFKSYYVVWKLISLLSASSFSFCCLNRTMQYGNNKKLMQNFRYSIGLNRTMQYGNFLLRHPQSLQKGLNRTMQYGNYRLLFSSLVRLSSFKSYYVVWKHKYLHLPPQNISRLNRTMQYGNWRRTHIPCQCEPCLNRTMQYGNRYDWKNTRSANEFKSYYVVWKQDIIRCKLRVIKV